MKTRVVKNKNGKYIVQFKREIFGISMFWWNTVGYTEYTMGAVVGL